MYFPNIKKKAPHRDRGPDDDCQCRSLRDIFDYVSKYYQAISIDLIAVLGNLAFI